MARLWDGTLPKNPPAIEEVSPMLWLVIWRRHCDLDNKVLVAKVYSYLGKPVRLLKLIPATRSDQAWRLEVVTLDGRPVQHTVCVDTPPEITTMARVIADRRYHQLLATASCAS